MFFNALGRFAFGQISDLLSANLTGVSSTAAAGTIRGSITGFTFNGVSSTGFAGSLVASDQNGLTGVAATCGVGTFVPAVAISIPGASVIASAGVLGDSGSAGLTGAAVTASAGSILGGVGATLVGVLATASMGTFIDALPFPIAGYDGLFGRYTFGQISVPTSIGVPMVAVTLTGVAATASAGTLSDQIRGAFIGAIAYAHMGRFVDLPAFPLAGYEGMFGRYAFGQISAPEYPGTIRIEIFRGGTSHEPPHRRRHRKPRTGFEPVNKLPPRQRVAPVEPKIALPPPSVIRVLEPIATLAPPELFDRALIPTNLPEIEAQIQAAQDATDLQDILDVLAFLDS